VPTDMPIELAEQSEAESMYDLEAHAPPEVRATLGITSTRLGGGVAMCARTDLSQYWSKALGFGFAEPVTAELIAELCAFYRAGGAALATLQLAPSVLPENWDEIRAEFNLTAEPAWVKLACDTRVVVERAEEKTGPSSSINIAPVAGDDGTKWAKTVVAGFGLPPLGSTELLASIVGRSRWHPFAAWDGDELVGGGSLRVNHHTGQFFGAATLPHARGRGAQTALLAARARMAEAAGCRWLVSETGAEAPGTHNSSLHNMLRAGFEVIYERQNWVWRPDAEHAS
jgi:GNAT superfamily N-acetyltransferase